MLILKNPSEREPIYVLSLEEYLQPRKSTKCTQLQQFPGGEQQQRPQRKHRPKRCSAWSTIKVQPVTAMPTTIAQPVNCKVKLNRWRQAFECWQQKRGKELAQTDDEHVLEDARCNWHSLLGKLPNVLAFLRARNDDGMCKRKSGFEIYCEMASFHGFVNFVGASTWQRALWFVIICVAIAMSAMVLAMSHLLSVGTPTTIYTESTTHPSWLVPFPAVSVCSVNRMSQRNATQLAAQLTAGTRMPLEQAVRLLLLLSELYEQQTVAPVDLQLLQSLLAAKNVSVTQAHAALQPRCMADLVRCMWQGELVACGTLLREQQTAQDRCCVFNFEGVAAEAETPHCCGSRTGLSLLLRPPRADYTASLFAGSNIAYQLYIHEPQMVADERLLTPQLLVAGAVSDVAVQPRQTYATAYVRGERVERRRCHFADEHPLRTFGRYSQVNCLVECWSALAYAHCGCVPVQWPRLYLHWRICEPTQLACIVAERENLTQMRSDFGTNYRYDHYAERFSCDCWPPCEYNQYQTQLDDAPLSIINEDNELIAGIQLDDHVLLHIHYNDIIAERLRIDVYENWLSFVGTFGGITGLFMGYSVVSAFEMIFFVFVRPACNWLTKQQIRYRVKRKQRQRERAAAVAATAAITATN